MATPEAPSAPQSRWRPAALADWCEVAPIPGTTLRRFRDPRGRLWLLKAQGDYLGEGEFRLHLALHRHLAEGGGPVAPLPPFELPLRDDQGRLYEVQGFLPGAPPAPQPRALEEVATSLAAFHRLGRDFSWPDLPAEELHREPRSRFAKARFYRRHLDRLLSRPWPPWATQLYARLDAAEQQLAASADEPQGPLHGDVTSDNALVTAEGCRLIDLDDVHWGDPASDVAWLLTTTAAMRHDEVSFRNRWSEPLAAAIVAGYGEHHRTLGPWLTASVVCALVDCFVADGRLTVSPRAFDRQGTRALALIDQLPLPDAGSKHLGLATGGAP